MDSFYFYDKTKKQWYAYWLFTGRSTGAYALIDEYLPISDDTAKKLSKASQNPNKNSDFIVMRNRVYRGIRADRLYIPINAEELRFVGKGYIYCAGESKRYSGGYSRSIISTADVLNPRILAQIKTQYPYVVDYIDKMQYDSRALTEYDEQNNYIRAKGAYNSLTVDQQLYYAVNGSGKYTFSPYP